jgi:hypothetical protein
VYDNNAKSLVNIEIDKIGEEQTILKKYLLLNPMLKLSLQMDKNRPEKQRATLEDFLKRFEKNLYIRTLEKAGNVLQEEFIPSTYTLPIIIFSAKGKDDYKELTSIAGRLREAIIKLEALNSKNAVPIDTVNALFTKGVEIWSKELEQLNVNDEKARINSSIGNALRYNLALGYLWLRDYKKANENIDLVPESIKKEKKFMMAGSYEDLAQQLRATIERFERNDNRVVIFSTSK